MIRERRRGVREEGRWVEIRRLELGMQGKGEEKRSLTLHVKGVKKVL